MFSETTLIGNVGKDPETRTMNNGNKVASFSLATSETWKDKASGERRERTEWHQVVVFGGMAEVVERFVKKGSMLFVKGQNRTRKWTDSDGRDRYSTEVVVDLGGVLRLLDRKEGGGGHPPRARDGRDPDPGAYHGSDAGGGGGRHGTRDDLDDDMPF